MFYPTPLEYFPPRNRVPIMQFFVEWLDNAGIQPEQIYSSHGLGVGGHEHMDRIRNLNPADPE
jgi:hypothetical protein